VKRVAAEIAATEPRIDVLINNAGALFSSREEAHRHEISRTMTGAPPSVAMSPPHATYTPPWCQAARRDGGGSSRKTW